MWTFLASTSYLFYCGVEATFDSLDYSAEPGCKWQQFPLPLCMLLKTCNSNVPSADSVSSLRRACGHVDVGMCPHQVLAATLTLSQPRGADYAQPILVSTPSFESHRRACSLQWGILLCWLQVSTTGAHTYPHTTYSRDTSVVSFQYYAWHKWKKSKRDRIQVQCHTALLYYQLNPKRISF